MLTVLKFEFRRERLLLSSTSSFAKKLNGQISKSDYLQMERFIVAFNNSPTLHRVLEIAIFFQKRGENYRSCEWGESKY